MDSVQQDPMAVLEDGAGPVDIRGSKVLVVDDNPQNTELVSAYLETLPVEVATAIDGVEAMAQAERFRPDVGLLDVMMPRMSGFEVCQKIKQNPALRDTVVIMVTALHEVGDFERAVECGCDDFITKPVNKLELVTRVRSLLRVRVLRRMLDELKRAR
jgi:CheY-like chemotaxis protein